MEPRTCLARFREWLWAEPAGAELWWQRYSRTLLRVLAIFFRESYHDGISLRASALAFIAILSLVPMLALGTAVLKGLGADGQVQIAAHRLIDRLETSGEPLIFEEEMEEDAVTLEQAAGLAKTKEAERRTLSAHLRRAVDHLFAYVERTNFAALGAFGIVGLVIAVIVVFDSIESSMNAIWQATSERSLGRKVMNYLAFLVLMPLTINLALATETLLASETLRLGIESWLPVGGVLEFVLSLLLPALLVASFTLLYRFLPHAHVRALPALAGGLFGGIAWLGVLSLYVSLQVGVARYNAIYGSFATLPLFLLWVQLCWIIFLAGAEMAFAVQNRHSYRPASRPLLPITRLALAFGIIEAAHHDFTNRRVTDLAGLARRLGEPEAIVRSVVAALLEAEMLRRVTDEEERYVPGVAADKLDPVEVVELILGTEVPPMRGSSLAIEALQAARLAVQNKKVAAG
ncbi:MAG: YihY/virulence factor BrkB family protein [Thermodesulfobacteriota bacterium]